MTDDNQDPLAALENALDDAKKPAVDDKVVDDKAKEAQESKELQRLNAEQEQEDARALQQQLADIKKSATNSPQEKARQEQENADDQAKQNKEESQEGYEIHQLDHTKIPSDS